MNNLGNEGTKPQRQQEKEEMIARVEGPDGSVEETNYNFSGSTINNCFILILGLIFILLLISRIGKIR